MQFSWLCHLRGLGFDQSSPVHPVSESSEGSTSVTKEGGPLSVTQQRSRSRTGILLSNFGAVVDSRCVKYTDVTLAVVD